MTTIKLYGGDFGGESMLVRCTLSRAESPVEVDYCEGEGWGPTQYQCADTRHTMNGLVTLGKELAADAMQIPSNVLVCEWEEVEEPGKVSEEWLAGAQCAALGHLEDPSWADCEDAWTTIEGWLSEHSGEPCHIAGNNTLFLEKSKRMATQDEIDTACQLIEGKTA
jgi:hypothetical protein